MRLIEEQRQTGVSLTTLGFGKGNLKEGTLEQLADRGNGNYFYVDSMEEAARIFGSKLGSTIETVAKDVKLQVEFNPARVSDYRLIGFENRAVAEADFKNDSVDGGEMGSGHTVTAFYEIKLGSAPGNAAPKELADELGFLKIRYKEPDGQTSRQKSFPITSADLKAAENTSEDFRFAAAVAEFGSVLRGQEFSTPLIFQKIEQVVEASSNYNPDAERSEFLGLVGKAAALKGETEPDRRYESHGSR